MIKRVFDLNKIVSKAIYTIVLLFIVMSIFRIISFANENNSSSDLTYTIKQVTSLTEIKGNHEYLGYMVETSGFHYPGDGGAAIYYVDNNAGEGSIVDIDLGSGLFAHLQYSDSVNVASIGIFPEIECSSQLNSALSYFSGKISNLVFNEGVYCFSNQVFLKSINMIGNNTTFRVLPNFNAAACRIFLTDINRHDVKYNIGFSNIDFLYETSSNHNLLNKEIILVCLTDIASCNIQNCNFTARYDSNNGSFMKCDLLWFQNTNNENITIENSGFYNLTGEYIPPNTDYKLIGGCIWFSGSGLNNLVHNVKIKNCDIITTLTDEAIGFWNCICQDIIIDNCSISNSQFYSHNILTFCKLYGNNIRVQNCNFNINSPDFAIVKIYQIATESEFVFESCDFNANAISNGCEMNAVFYTNDYENANPNYLEKHITINKCRFNSNNQSSFTYLINVQHSKSYNYDLINCDINVSFNRAFLNAFASESTFNISNNKIENPNNVPLTREFENCILNN